VRRAKPGRYGDGGGLYLLVRSPEAKFWLFRYTMPGAKMRELGLGRAGIGAGAVSLAEARGRASNLYRLVKAGVDPLAKREADAASAAAEAAAAQIRSKTFRDVAEMFLASHEAGWRNPKHRQQWRNTLDTYTHPHMGAVPVTEVATAHVMSALEPIWTAKPETASRVRGRIEAVLDYAAAREWRRGENPARWRGHLAKLLPARGKVARVEHHAALPWAEIPSFMYLLRQREGMAARALEFGILTAARTAEVLGTRWCEIDFEQAVWVVPAKRMKAGREHRVPLAPAAVALLRGLLPPNAPNHLTEAAGAAGLVFPGASEGRPLSNMAMLMLLRRMERGDLTAHGFRSSFRDWVAEATTFPRELAEAALAHVNGDKTEAAYQRGDLLAKRRRMMEAWAAYCATQSGPCDDAVHAAAAA
jgi:integrase